MSERRQCSMYGSRHLMPTGFQCKRTARQAWTRTTSHFQSGEPLRWLLGLLWGHHEDRRKYVTPSHHSGVRAHPWWHHRMGTFPALLALCAGNSPVTGEFPAQRSVTWSFDIFFDLRLNKRLRKQSWGWRFETPLRSSWRHCNAGVPLRWLLGLLWGHHDDRRYTERRHIAREYVHNHSSDQWLPVNASFLSAAYMRQWIGSSLVQITACGLIGAKSLSKPILGHCK